MNTVVCKECGYSFADKEPGTYFCLNCYRKMKFLKLEAFCGAKPGELAQLFEEPPKIALNLKTAEMIGFDPPVDIMLAADEIFQDIETPPVN